MAGPRPTDNLRIPLIKTHHKSPYPSISPARPELSQAGKTVLIAGGSAGIGFAIARAFVQAKASRVILLGRRRDVLEASAAKLAAEVADKMSTTVEGRVCDISNLNDTARLWENLQRESIFVDVLVLNAAVTGKLGPILSHALADTWSAFEVNVRTILDFTGHFYGQDGEAGRQKVCRTEPSHSPKAGRQAGRPTCLCTTLTLCVPAPQYLINVSTSAIHNLSTESALIPAYGLTKNAGTLLLQQIALDTDPDKMQVVSYHPGGVRTELAVTNNVPEDAWAWDDGT